VTTATALLCVVCLRREVSRPQVCDGDRVGLLDTIKEIWELTRELDPSVRPPARGDRVSGGSVDPAVPVNLDAIDLDAPLQMVIPVGPDQIGHQSVRTTCTRIAVGWLRTSGATTASSTGYGPSWLEEWSDWACDHHSGIAGDVATLRKLALTLRAHTRHDSSDDVFIGRCPGRGGPCGAALHANPHQDSTECPRCQVRWPRRNWLTFGTGAAA